jgi:hypothetical protein
MHSFDILIILMALLDIWMKELIIAINNYILLNNNEYRLNIINLLSL